MDKKRQGTACIINVLTFEKDIMKSRTGTNMDRDRLTQLFEQLHFRVVVFNDEDGLSAAEMLEKIKETAKDAKDAQCFVLFILSHGGEINDAEVVFGRYGKPVTKKAIIRAWYLSDENYPILRGVVRLVFFQCCRGSIIGIRDELDAPDEQDGCQPTEGNLLVGFPCREGFACLRNPVRGSRYVQTIVKVFMEEAQNTDIQTMLTHVSNAQKELMQPQNDIHQDAGHLSHLQKEFFFFPGIQHM